MGRRKSPTASELFAQAGNHTRRKETSESEDEINAIPNKRTITNATQAAQKPFKPPVPRSTSSGASSSHSANPSRNNSAQQKASSTNASSRRQTTSNSSKATAAQRQKDQMKGRAQNTAPLKKYTSGIGETLSERPKGRAKGHEVAPEGLVTLGAKKVVVAVNERQTSLESSRSVSRASSLSSSSNKHDNGFDSLFTTDGAAPLTAKPFPLDDDSYSKLSQNSYSQTSTSRGILPMQPSAKAVPDPFPMDGIVDSSSYASHAPRSFPVDDETVTSHPSYKPQSFPVDDGPTSRLPQSFPMDSDPSPPRSSQSTSQVNGNSSAKVLSNARRASSASSIGKEDSPARPRPMPFPLESPTRSIPSSGSKRAASSSPIYQSSPSRKFKLAKHLEMDPDFFDEDSIIVDPKTLCPFCDEPWPTHPSSKLVKLLSRAKALSWPQPRHGNTLGLKAEFENFKDVCTEHRMEGSVIPKGVERGWPTEIDFDTIPRRLKKFRSRLSEFVENPRKSSFFREAMQDVKDIGALAAMSAQGQLAAFERSRPGYYGERGTIRISRTMNNLFPALTTHTAAFKPLDSMTFVTAVLVPECALLLIKDDLKLSSDKEALRVLLDSQAFGVAAHPDRGEDDDMQIDEMGSEMRERIERGRERLHKHLDEARETVNGSRGATTSQSKLGLSEKGKGKGRARESAKSASSRASSVLSTRSRSSVINISSSDNNNTDDDDDEVMIDDPTPKPKKKRLLGRSFTPAQPFSSQLNMPSLESEVRSRRLHNRSVSIQSDASSSSKWSKNLRDDGGFDIDDSD